MFSGIVEEAAPVVRIDKDNVNTSNEGRDSL